MCDNIRPGTVCESALCWNNEGQYAARCVTTLAGHMCENALRVAMHIDTRDTVCQNALRVAMPVSTQIPPPGLEPGSLG